MFAPRLYSTYNSVFQRVSFSRAHIYPTVPFSSWSLFGYSWRTLCGIFVWDQQIQIPFRMKALQLFLFYLRLISSVAVANISKWLLPLPLHRVNRSQAGMRSHFICSLLFPAMSGILEFSPRGIQHMQVMLVFSYKAIAKTVSCIMVKWEKYFSRDYCRPTHANNLLRLNELRGCVRFSFINNRGGID